MDSRNRVVSCKRGDWRLLDKNFELKSIKEKIKHVFNNNSELNFQNQLPNEISYQTAPTSPNPYITWKLNNIDEAKVLKKERRD